jgi:hypothetical protein
MKIGLGPLENSRTFYSPKGNQTVIRDTNVPQRNTPQPEPVKETELVVEEIVVDESTLEIIAETPAPITPKKKNERPTKN